MFCLRILQIANIVLGLLKKLNTTWQVVNRQHARGSQNKVMLNKKMIKPRNWHPGFNQTQTKMTIISTSSRPKPEEANV